MFHARLLLPTLYKVLPSFYCCPPSQPQARTNTLQTPNTTTTIRGSVPNTGNVKRSFSNTGTDIGVIHVKLRLARRSHVTRHTCHSHNGEWSAFCTNEPARPDRLFFVLDVSPWSHRPRPFRKEFGATHVSRTATATILARAGSQDPFGWPIGRSIALTTHNSQYPQSLNLNSHSLFHWVHRERQKQGSKMMTFSSATSSGWLSKACVITTATAVVIATGTAGVHGAADSSSIYDGANFTILNATNTSNIINGKPATFGQYPSFATVDGTSLCGATLIWPDILLTAAHCAGAYQTYIDFFFGIVITPIVYIGGTSSSNAPEALRVKGWSIDSAYNERTLNNDIMLVYLNGFSRQPVSKWNTDPAVPIVGQTATVIGHGKTNTTDPDSTSDFLKEAQVSIIPFEDGAKGYTAGVNFDPNAILFAKNGTGVSCQGDSGGPLFDDRGTIVGLVSFGAASGCGNLPTGYTRVSSYSTFILRHICAYSGVRPLEEKECCFETNCKFLGLYNGYKMFTKGPLGRCRSRCVMRPFPMVERGWKCGLCDPWDDL